MSKPTSSATIKLRIDGVERIGQGIGVGPDAAANALDDEFYGNCRAECSIPSAYLSRNCGLAAEKGLTPIIKPKRGCTRRKRGCQPWRDMVTLLGG